MEKPTILIVGTLDTKLDEILFLRSQILSSGFCAVKILDVGRRLRQVSTLPIPADEVVPRILRIALPHEDLPRGEYIKATIHQCIAVVHFLLNTEAIHGIVSAGGSSGTSIATALMRYACPVGFPKLMVSTMASGDISSYVAETDITMMYSVVDVAGLNSILQMILSNAAGAIVGMTTSYFRREKTQESQKAEQKKRIGITMFGVTTPGTDAIRGILESKYEVFVFHATGAGGRAMERLIEEEQIDAVIDLTTTEIADELNGGVLSAGPERLEAGAKKGIPMVISVGACDMVNFGPKDTVPEKHKGRKLFEHNPSVTLMRTSPEECAAIGHFIAKKLKENATQPGLIKVLLPTKGVSVIDRTGEAFHDEEADEQLFQALETGLKDTKIEVQRHASNVNDEEFAKTVAEQIVTLMEMEPQPPDETAQSPSINVIEVVDVA